MAPTSFDPKHKLTAADLMTRTVIAIRPDTPLRAIAELLFQHGISAVPVVDDGGRPVGMVSEGDLLPRDESEREERRDWWLRMLAEGEELSPDFISHVEGQERTARQIMSAPVITVPETASLVEVAEVLSGQRIKRVPVLHEDRMVGIISRADLIKAVAQPIETEPEPEPSRGPFAFIFPSEQLEALKPPPQPAPPPPPAADTEFSADAFRSSVHRHEEEETNQRAQAHRLAVEKRQHEVNEMLAADLTDAAWQHLLHDARIAAGKGEKEFLLAKFPCELCTDHGRAVNVPDPSWPTTLRGLPAQIFLRWRHDLRERGFKLNARVTDFPDGLPGDIGLFLVWGE